MTPSCWLRACSGVRKVVAVGRADESWTMFSLLSESTWRCIPATAAVLIALLENGKVVGWEVPLVARAAVQNFVQWPPCPVEVVEKEVCS